MSVLNRKLPFLVLILIFTATLVSAGNMENLVNEKVVPDVLDSAPTGKLLVKYPSGAEVKYGLELTPTQVKDLPTFEYDSSSDQLYTLAMVDPDAPSRAEPKLREILHYLIVNIPGSELSKGDTLAAYIGAGAPKGTGLHRYIFALYKQENGKLVIDMKIPNNSRDGRINFSLKKFAETNKLGKPIAANFFQAQFDDYVLKLHEQLSSKP